MSDALPNNYNNVAFGGGYDPGQRYQEAEQRTVERETQAVNNEAANSGSSNIFGALTLGPHTANLIKNIVGDMAFGAWDDFEQWLEDNEAVFTGEAGAEMRSIFIHGFNTGAAMRADNEQRNGKTTFTLVS